MKYAGELISLLFLVVQMYCTPYHSVALNIAQSSSLLINVFTLFVGIMLIVDADLEAAAIKAGESYDTSGRTIVSVILFIANLAVIAIPIFIAASNSSSISILFGLLLGHKKEDKLSKLHESEVISEEGAANIANIQEGQSNSQGTQDQSHSRGEIVAVDVYVSPHKSDRSEIVPDSEDFFSQQKIWC